MSPIIQSTEHYRDTAAILHFYIDPNAGSESTSFVWYEDDGATYAAESKGLAKKLQCSSTTQSKICTMTFTPEIGANLWEKYFNFKLLIHTSTAPKQILIAGEKVKFKFDKNTETIQLKDHPKLKIDNKELQIEIQW
jgi:arginine/lysine/ornithine decarboxylase